MLKPDKHTNPEYTVVDIAMIVIEQIKKNDIINYDDLFNGIIKQTSESIKDVFLYSISFLFLLNKIEYVSDLDAIRLTA